MALIVASGSHVALFRIPRLEHIALGILLGHVLVGASLCLVSLSLRQARKVPSLISGALSVCAARPDIVLHYLMVAVYEECVWRVAVQSRLGWSCSAIVLTSLLFTLAHFRLRKAPVMVTVDLFLFSIVLGYLFTVFQAVYLLIVVHLVRNVDLCFIACHRQCRLRFN